MKKILLFAVAVLVLGSCINDKGNYDYTEVDQPVVVVEDVYMIDLGANLVVEPEITYPDVSRLSFKYELLDPTNNEVIVELEAQADGSLNVQQPVPPGVYGGLLTVTVPDDSGINLDPDNQGLKMFYTFTVIIGSTEFTQGSLILVDDGGQAKLHFVMPDNTVVEDVYNILNSEPLPGAPLRLHSAMVNVMGGSDAMPGARQGYWITTDNGGTADGVLIEPEALLKTRTFAENFLVSQNYMSTPSSSVIYMNPQMGMVSSGSMVASVGGRVFSGQMLGYFAMSLATTWGRFGAGAVGSYNAQNLVQDKLMNPGADGGSGCVWGYDPTAKRMLQFAISDRANTMLTISGTHAAWNPASVGLDLLTMQFSMSGGYLVGTDTAGRTWLYGFNLTVSQDMKRQIDTTTPVEFTHTSLLTPDTKWLLDPAGVFYFSSGNRVYRYNPLDPTTAEPLVAEMTGNVTMMEFRTYETSMAGPGSGVETVSTQMVVGTDAGSVYYLDLVGPTGSAGSIIKTISGFTGAPVDIYDRINKPVA